MKKVVLWCDREKIKTEFVTAWAVSRPLLELAGGYSTEKRWWHADHIVDSSLENGLTGIIVLCRAVHTVEHGISSR